MSVVRLTRDEKRERTREELIAAAEKRFVEFGFHATSVDQVAADAGYTKGAVYGNFDSKEDLFFAVYERRADAAVERVERVFAEHEDETATALERLAGDVVDRRGGDDGWLAVFFEFWAHVIRHPELRDRFAAIHARFQVPFVEAFERMAAEHGSRLPVEPRQFVVAANAMEIGLGLERLTQPDLIDAGVGEQMARLLVSTAHGREGRDEQ